MKLLDKVAFTLVAVGILGISNVGFAQPLGEVGEALTNDFQGISTNVVPADEGATRLTGTTLPNAPPAEPTVGEVSHEHYKLSIGVNCIVNKSGTIVAIVDGEEVEVSCGDPQLNLKDLRDGPHNHGPLCSCVMGSPEAVCETNVNRIKDAVAKHFKRKIHYNHEGTNYLVEVDLAPCYNCDVYCNISDRSSQPGGCGTLNSGGGVSSGGKSGGVAKAY